MINFILNVLSVIVALEIRDLIINLIKVYRLNTIMKTVNNDMYENLKRKDLL